MIRRILYTLSVAVGISLTGCIHSDDGLCTDSGSAADPTPVDVHLTFVIRQGDGRMSRAPGHEQYPATEAECLIDLDGGDYRVLVFDWEGRLLQQLETVKIRDFDYADGVTECLVRGTLDDAWTDFQIVVLANWESFGADYSTVLSGVRTLDDLEDRSRTLPYRLPVDGWRPFSGSNRGIPMTGLQSYTGVDWSANTTDGVRRLDGAVSLLRAVAKIEVVDRINTLSADRVSIDAVSLYGYNATGCFIPDMKSNPLWNNPVSQVVTPTLPSVSEYLEYGELTLAKDDDVTLSDGKSYARYSAYISEFAISQVSDKQKCPKLRITVRNPDVAPDIASDKVVYTIDVANYVGGSATDPLASLLRNHIYRYEVNSASANILELDYTVCPWEVCEIKLPEYPE